MILALHNLAKSRSTNNDWISDGQTHLKLIDLLKKEFKVNITVVPVQFCDYLNKNFKILRDLRD